MADKVTSPVWQALSDLDQRVQRELAGVAGALKDADQRMAGGRGDVWVGPTARGWGSRLSGAAGDVARQAHAFAALVRRELAAHPKEVTQEAADTERRLLAGRLM